MGLQHEHAQRFGTSVFQYLMEQEEVPQRLAHLLGIHLQHAGMHPVVCEGGPASAFRLSALVLVVREHQVLATAMDVERKPQILMGHG